VLPGDDVTVKDAMVNAIRTFAASVFAHVPGKTMRIGRLLDRNAAETYLLECRDLA
jgi:hypothetical protein